MDCPFYHESNRAHDRGPAFAPRASPTQGGCLGSELLHAADGSDKTSSDSETAGHRCQESVPAKPDCALSVLHWYRLFLRRLLSARVHRSRPELLRKIFSIPSPD